MTDDNLKEKFLSNLKVEKEPKTDVEDLVELVEPEPLVQPQTMKHHLLCQQLIFKRDIVAIQKWVNTWLTGAIQCQRPEQTLISADCDKIHAKQGSAQNWLKICLALPLDTA